MAFVCIERRNAHLAGHVRRDFVNGREGKLARATRAGRSIRPAGRRPMPTLP